MIARRGALVLLVCVAAGCAASRPEKSLEPQAERAGRTAPVAVAAPAPTPEDSLADQAALEALHELEFRSLAKGAGHVRGVVPAPRFSEFEASLAAPRGGAASAARPTYDIDVASFAEHDRVRYYVDYFLDPARDRFTIWLGRLPRYEGMIRERFQANGVPEDLVYLAIIESGYSNTAVSRSNAVGMWQFIRSTAMRYGLTVNTWLDERRDPYKATEAAARHLKDLYAQFGSWYLAAAAYNGGAGRVERGLRRLREAPAAVSDETFFDLSDRRYLRRETRDYVPKLIAAAIIAKDPLRFGFDSLPILGALVFDEITVPNATGLDVIARLADTTSRAVMELNRHYVRGVTPPRQSSIVRVPRGSGPKVLQRYAELPANERVSFIEHVVQRGETLGEIGERYGVSVSLVQAANDYVHPRRLRIGRRLVIPVSSAARTEAAAGRAPRPRAAVSGVRYHIVRRGETLWIISRKYGVTVADIRRWNGIPASDVTIRVGEHLAVVPPAGATR